MGAGPLLPISVVPRSSGSVFDNVHVCAGANGTNVAGIGVVASVASDVTADVIWQLPDTLPSGTLKLRLLCIANATSGNAKINPKWNCGALNTDPSGLTLNAEGTQTLTWAAGENDKFKELLLTLDASTAAGGQYLYMSLMFEGTASWTLAADMTCIAELIWV